MTLPTPVRLSRPADVGDLIALVAADNPVISNAEVVTREIVSDRIGALVGVRSSLTTLLYVWTHPIDDLAAWMSHAAHWLERYPIWRSAYGLPASSSPVRMVLAAPEICDTVRSALRLIVEHVAVLRFVNIDVGGRAALGWEELVEIRGREAASRGVLQGATRSATPIPDLTPEELAFFQTR